MDVASLAALAGNTLVAAAVTDAFEGVRRTVAAVFGRGKPDEAIERRLDATRRQLIDAAHSEKEYVQADQARHWETRFADFLADHPEAEDEIRTLVEEFRGVHPEPGGIVTNTISGAIIRGPVVMGRDFGDITIGSQPPASEAG